MNLRKSDNKIIIIPESFGIQKTEKFISDVSFVFLKSKYKISYFKLQLKNNKKIALLNQILLYKFISYTAENNSFEKPVIDWDSQSIKNITISGLSDLIDIYINKTKETKKLIEAYKKLRVDEVEGLFIAPHHIKKDNENNRQNLETKYLNTVRKYYVENEKRKIVSTIITEAFSNFWAHANETTNTVMVSKGNQEHFELTFADTGDGIVTTLRKQLKEYEGRADDYVLLESVKQGVTSKPSTDHMGLGLWLIKRLVELNGGQFKLFSEKGRYSISDRKEEKYLGSYWKGTILFIALNLNNPISISGIPELNIDYNLKIRWE